MCADEDIRVEDIRVEDIGVIAMFVPCVCVYQSLVVVYYESVSHESFNHGVKCVYWMFYWMLYWMLYWLMCILAYIDVY